MSGLLKKTNSSYPEQNSTDFPIKITEKLNKFRIAKGAKVSDKFKSQGNLDLFSYQKLLELYMGDSSPYRGILLYHTLGSGKTITAINVADSLDMETVVLLPKSLMINFIEEVITFIPEFNRNKEYDTMTADERRKYDKQLYKKVKHKYKFISSNSGKSAQKISELGSVEVASMEANMAKFIKTTNTLDNKLLIIDEVHNLIVNMIDANAVNGARILSMIMEAKNLKLIFLSGSPVVSDPFELGIMFNLLRGYLGKEKFTAFPENYEEFYKYFVDSEKNTIKNKEIFQERIVGLVSYYDATFDDAREIFPEKLKPIIVRVPMSSYQWKLYIKYRTMEQDEERKIKFAKTSFVKLINTKPKRSTKTSFRAKTRQLSDFTLPENHDKTIDKQILKKLTEKHLTTDLKKYGPKIKAIIDNITKVQGSAFVYSQFISLEGIGVLSRAMEFHGWNNYNTTKKTGKDTFAIFSGNTSDNMRMEIISVFNQPKNKDGSRIKVLLATATAAEGINLKNVRQVHIMEPYWHANRLDQVIGRAIRTNSHQDLPKEDRTVQTFIYLAVPPKDSDMMSALNERLTTDEHLFFNAQRRRELLTHFLNAMKEMAIDCQINMEHNKLTGKCRICAPSGEPMFPNKLKDHMLPFGSNCLPPETLSDFTTFVKDGVKYRRDKKGKIYKEVEEGVLVEVKGIK